jgi:PKD repeat protein
VPGTPSSSCDAYFWPSVSGSTVTFYDSTTPNNIVYWSFGDGNYGYSSRPTHTYANPGTYTACHTVYDVNASGDTLICDTFCQTLTIAATSTCTASFGAYPDSINMSASSFPVFFNNTSTGVYYLWNFGDGATDTASNPSHIYTTAGTYTACLYVITAYDNLSLPIICDSTCVTFTVGNPIATCQASYYLGLDTNNLYNLYIINNSTGTSSSTSYSWSFGDGNTSTAQYPTHQYSTFGLYTLCLTISDSSSGCLSTYCDSIGLDSNGNLLKRDGFGITVVDENDLLSTDDIELINGLSVYPNPSTGLYTVKLSLRSSEDVSINAINSLGQVVLSEERSGLSGTNEYGIDMSTQPNGIYFLTLRAGSQAKNVKLYIQR